MQWAPPAQTSRVPLTPRLWKPEAEAPNRTQSGPSGAHARLRDKCSWEHPSWALPFRICSLQPPPDHRHAGGQTEAAPAALQRAEKAADRKATERRHRGVFESVNV